MSDGGQANRSELRLRVPETGSDVSALLLRPDAARAMLVLAHGAGAGMTHPFLERLAAALADRGVATLRYQFPYVEANRRLPDSRPVLFATVRAAVPLALETGGGLTTIAGGKSMGGRMTSMLAAQETLPGVRGLAFFGFPLHAAGRRGAARAEHLDAVELPMLFLSGTRDALADLALLREVVERLGNRARLHEIEDGDHSFAVRARVTGKKQEDIIAELAAATAAFAARVA